MKYTKSIIAFLLINLFLVFSMIFVANNSRELEKDNIKLNKKINKISQDIKINKIELTAHQNTSYLNKLYSLYFFAPNPDIIPNIVSLEQILDKEKNIKLANTNNISN